MSRKRPHPSHLLSLSQVTPTLAWLLRPVILRLSTEMAPPSSSPREKSVRDFGGPAFFRDAYSGHSLTFGPESLPAAPPVANMPARMSVRLRALCPVETTGSPAGAPGLGSEPRRPSGRRGVVFICTRYLQARGIYRRYLPWSSPASAQDLIVHASVRLSRPLTVAERLFTGAYTSIARERGSFFLLRAVSGSHGRAAETSEGARGRRP